MQMVQGEAPTISRSNRPERETTPFTRIERNPLMTDHNTIEEKTRRLEERFHAMGSVVVAYSGGVDSAFLAKIAHDTLGERALAVTAVSPSLAASELAEAKSVAAQIGVRHLLLESHELSDSRYLAN